MENTNEIESVNPYDTMFIGYNSIGEALGNARIVFLGEQDHGDGTTIAAKVKIVEYLVKNHGFKVIALESGFYELNTIWSSNMKIDEKINQLKNEIHGVWSSSTQFQKLFKLISEVNGKGGNIDLTGFDCRRGYSFSQLNYVKDLSSYLNKTKFNQIENRNFLSFKKILQGLIDKEYTQKPDKNEISLFKSIVDAISFHVDYLPKSDENDFWKQEIKSLRKQAMNAWYSSKKRGSAINNIRDEAMADNLLWLINEKYNGQKVIVWAASYHVAKNIESVESTRKFKPEKLTTMGSVFHNKIKDGTYYIGFISSSGIFTDFAYNNQPRTVRPLSIFSLEHSVSMTGYNYAFLDIRNIPYEKSFGMAGLSHYELNGRWNEVFDAVFYIREMKPSTYIKK